MKKIIAVLSFALSLTAFADVPDYNCSLKLFDVDQSIRSNTTTLNATNNSAIFKFEDVQEVKGVIAFIKDLGPETGWKFEDRMGVYLWFNGEEPNSSHPSTVVLMPFTAGQKKIENLIISNSRTIEATCVLK